MRNGRSCVHLSCYSVSQKLAGGALLWVFRQAYRLPPQVYPGYAAVSGPVVLLFRSAQVPSTGDTSTRHLSGKIGNSGQTPYKNAQTPPPPV